MNLYIVIIIKKEKHAKLYPVILKINHACKVYTIIFSCRRFLHRPLYSSLKKGPPFNYSRCPLHPTKRLCNLIQASNQQSISTTAYSINIFNGPLAKRKTDRVRSWRTRRSWRQSTYAPLSIERKLLDHLSVYIVELIFRN